MGYFNVRDYQNIDEVKELFKEYSQIKGAEGCFVSFNKELGFSEVSFTSRPDVMQVGYGLYQRMGFEETAENNGTVSMRMVI